MKRIKDITGPGETFLGFALIKKSSLGQTVKQDNFLTLELVDGDSSIEAKLWGCSEDDSYIFCDEALVKVKGDVGEYRGKPQLKIEKIRIVEERDGVTVDQFVPRAPEDTNEMVKELEGYIESIETPILKEITHRLYKKNKEQFIIHPAAAKLHHSMYSGLVFHVLSMLRQCDHFAKQYKHLNRDVMVAGIVSHDIGKLLELDFGLVSTNYTNTTKRLLGHIAIGVLWVDREVQQIKLEGREITKQEEGLIDELLHIILSHHGPIANAWGSSVDPMTPESLAVHRIDKNDADNEMLRMGLEDKEEGEFHKIWPVGTFYKKESD